MSTGERSAVPQGWIQSQLGDVLTVLRGVTYKGSEARKTPSDGFLPVLRATNIDGSLTFDGLVYVPDHYVSRDQLLQSGDIVIAASSGSRAIVGKAAQLKNDWLGSFGAFCYALRSVQHVDSTFLAWFLQTNEYRNRVSELAAGVNINNLRREHIEETPIRLPPLPEQRRIVAAIETQLTRLDAAVAALERARANLKRYRAAVLKAACEGRLVPTEAEVARAEGRGYEAASVLLERIGAERDGVEAHGGEPHQLPDDLPALPDGWHWARVDKLASQLPGSIQSGPFGSQLLHSEFVDHGILAIGIDNVLAGRFSMGRQHRITEQKFRELKKFEARPLDVLITVMATVGRCCVVPENLDPAIITKHVYRITVNQRAVVPKYLMICLWGGEAVRAQLFGQVKGQTRPGINGEILRRLSIPIPPLTEQHRIVAEVERRLSVVEEMEGAIGANLRRAERVRQGVLRRAFAGELVGQDPTDEPASVLLARIRGERVVSPSKPVRRGKRRGAKEVQGALW